MAWIYGTDWIRRLGNGVAEKYNDGVEIMAVAVAPIVNPIADGRVPYFQAKKEDEYVPEVYQKAAKVMARGVAEHATQRQMNQARAESNAANVEVQKKTADYQDAAVDIATLPTFLLGGPEILAGKGIIVRTTGRLAVGTVEIGAVDLSAREAAHGVFNAASPGLRSSDTLGTNLINLASPGTLRPSAVTLAKQEQERAKGSINLTKMFEEEHPEEMAEINRKAFADVGLNPDGTPLNRNPSGVSATQGQRANQDQGNNGKPDFLSSIVSVIASILQSIADFFKGSDQQPQTVAAGTASRNTIETPVIPSGIPAPVQNAQKGK